MDLGHLCTIVDEGMEKMGVAAADARVENTEGQWLLVRDFMPIYIDAWEETESNPWNYQVWEQDKTIFQLSLPFCHAPTVKKDEFLIHYCSQVRVFIMDNHALFIYKY